MILVNQEEKRRYDPRTSTPIVRFPRMNVTDGFSLLEARPRPLINWSRWAKTLKYSILPFSGTRLSSPRVCLTASENMWWTSKLNFPVASHLSNPQLTTTNTDNNTKTWRATAIVLLSDIFREKNYTSKHDESRICKEMKGQKLDAFALFSRQAARSWADYWN